MILNDDVLTIDKINAACDLLMNEIGHFPPARHYKPVYILHPCVPVKDHIKKKWMRNSYHQRIQKKWNKRFGLKHFDKILETPQGLHVPEPIYYQNRELMHQLQGLSL